MVNQYNKVRKNLTKLNRVKRKSFKVSTKTDAKGIVAATNAEMSKVQEASAVAALDAEPSTKQEANKVARNVLAVRKGRVGKSNSVIAPTIIGKQKLRKMMTRAKHLQRHAAQKNGGGDTSMEDVEYEDAPAEMDAEEEEDKPVVEAKPTAKGTTLGGPPPS
ncbi:hypothetical protein HK097_011023 [Rhizophlyctis rosea]|uniref:Uncharacterized protein n=1 Tax=Rhizophlyctis rosea TaxID=64517 RepID=A0AAD5S8J5_9FUNG|nr:hypothetical protein HK097_011023 [Rhizophlyctis rosea]